MKRIVLTIGLIAASALTLLGQGSVSFNNLTSGSAITVYPLNQGASGGFGGAYVGANYSIQLLWAPQASYASYSSFFAAVVDGSAPVAFFGTTGGNPTTDGAGLFDGGTVPNPVGTSMPPGNYTMVARAWFNGGQFSTYDSASVAGRNTGLSSMFNQTVTAISPPPPPHNISVLPSRY